jgi:hypothetical protein
MWSMPLHDQSSHLVAYKRLSWTLNFPLYITTTYHKSDHILYCLGSIKRNVLAYILTLSPCIFSFLPVMLSSCSPYDHYHLSHGLSTYSTFEYGVSFTTIRVEISLIIVSIIETIYKVFICQTRRLACMFLPSVA